MLLLAYFTDPTLVGIYGIAVVCLLFVQSATDSAVRQVAVLAIGQIDGLAFLRRYQVVASAVGGLAMIAVAAMLRIIFSGDVASVSLSAIFLLALIPVIQAARVVALARLQLDDQWRPLATYQFLSTGVSFSVALLVLISTRSLLAPCVQMVVAEALFATACLLSRRSRRPKTDFGPPVIRRQPDPDEANRQLHPRREFWHMSIYSILSWGQLQSDRLFMSLFAGPAVLGAYSLGSSMARSGGDAAAMSSANILRSTIAKETIEARKIVEKLLSRGLAVVFLAALISVGFSEIVVKRLLSSQWDSALQIVPILALGSIPAYLTWSMTVILVASGRAQVALPAKVLGVVLSVLVAAGAAHSLTLAAGLAVFREIVVCSLTLLPARKLTPLKSVGACSATFVAGACGVMLLVAA